MERTRPADRGRRGRGAARSARFPIGAAIEFDDLEVHSRVAALDRLRDFEPISWVPALGGWLVTSHELARELLGRSDEFTVWAEPNLVRASLGVMMLTSDGAEHARQRQPFDEPFRVRPVRERFAEPVHRHIDALLASCVRAGGCELVEEFAAPFAIGLAGRRARPPARRRRRACRSSTRRSPARWSTTATPSRSAAPTSARAELNAILLEEVRALAQPARQLDHQRRRQRPRARALATTRSSRSCA